MTNDFVHYSSNDDFVHWKANKRSIHLFIYTRITHKMRARQFRCQGTLSLFSKKKIYPHPKSACKKPKWGFTFHTNVPAVTGDRPVPCWARSSFLASRASVEKTNIIWADVGLDDFFKMSMQWCRQCQRSVGAARSEKSLIIYIGAHSHKHSECIPKNGLFVSHKCS